MLGHHTQAGGTAIAGVGLFIVGKILQFKNDLTVKRLKG